MTATPAADPQPPMIDRPAPGRLRHLPPAGTAAVAVMVGVGLPWLLDGYTISLVTNMLIMAVLAVSVHLLMVAGLPAFGQTAYLAIGAYTAALLALAGVSSGPSQAVVAVLAGAVAAALTGPLLLRTRGEAFLMASFAVGQLLTITAAKAPALGCDEGLSTSAITLPGAGAITRDGYLYLYALAVSVLLIAAVAVAMRTRFGLVLRAIAGHEARTAALGHRVTGRLLAAHTLAGAVAAGAGALLVAAHHYISPGDGAFDVAACALLAVTIGAGSLTGTITGAVLIITTRDLAGAATGGHGPALLGLLFVVVAYLPLRQVASHLRTITVGGRR
jgi:branched-chain amino acid transport system permease protein